MNLLEYSNDWRGKRKKQVERQYDSMKMFLPKKPRSFNQFQQALSNLTLTDNLVCYDE